MIEAYPLQWPTGWKRTEYPEHSRFGSWNRKPTIADATLKSHEEIRMLGGSDGIISSNVELRRDGLPYSGRKEPKDRGVAVYFKWDGQDIVIACDSYDLVGCNLWAVAKTIEAMRGIDRWGCSDLLNRAFTGFKALPEQGTTTKRDWWVVLDVEKDALFEEIRMSYKSKAKFNHPDTPTGDKERFQEINEAYEEANKYHNV